MTDAIYNPKELGDVLDRALDRCFERIGAGEIETIAFMVIRDRGGKMTDQRVIVEQVDGEIRVLNDPLAREPGNVSIYALAFTGQLIWRGRPQDAVLIEAAECGNDESMLLAQRYRFKMRGRPRIELRPRLDLVRMSRSRIHGTEREYVRVEP